MLATLDDRRRRWGIVQSDKESRTNFQFDNADAYPQAIQGLSQIVTDVVVQKTFVDGPDVLTWYDLHTSIAPPGPVAEWSRVENGKISMVRVVFDPRAFAPAHT